MEIPHSAIITEKISYPRDTYCKVEIPCDCVNVPYYTPGRHVLYFMSKASALKFLRAATKIDICNIKEKIS